MITQSCSVGFCFVHEYVQRFLFVSVFSHTVPRHVRTLKMDQIKCTTVQSVRGLNHDLSPLKFVRYMK